MASNFVGLLFIFSLGTIVSSAAIDDWIRGAPVPPCIKQIDGYLSTNDSSLREFYLRAAAFWCRPGFTITAKQDRCMESGYVNRLVAERCQLFQAAETNCSAMPEAVNCALDLVGTECGGDDAVVIWALQMEFRVHTGEAPQFLKCAIDTLHERQKHPKSPKPPAQPEMRISELCTKVEEGLTKAITDHEYYEQKAKAMLCDGYWLKRYVQEANRCMMGHIMDLKCKPRKSDEDDCGGHREVLRCHHKHFTDWCGPLAADVYAFQGELTTQLLKAGVIGPKSHMENVKCIDEMLDELKALQQPKKDSNEKH